MKSKVLLRQVHRLYWYDNRNVLGRRVFIVRTMQGVACRALAELLHCSGHLRKQIGDDLKPGITVNEGDDRPQLPVHPGQVQYEKFL